MNQDSSQRIVEPLRRWIASATPGARLPSTRALVAEHGASAATVQRALRTLAAEGAVETRPGTGTFVRAARAAPPTDYSWQTAALGAPERSIPSISTALRSRPPESIALHSGYPDDELLPVRLVRSAIARAGRSGAAVDRPPTVGDPDLRAWFAGELAARTIASAAAPRASDVVILPGSQSGLGAIFRGLVGSGGPLLVESPTYWGAIRAAAQIGVRLVPVASGPDGPDPEAIDRAFRETGARALYAQPSFANPTGAQWTTDRADRVLEIVRDHGAFLIEDDWAHDFGIDAEPRPLAGRDDSGHVVYLRSLTKSVSPAIRVAAAIVRGPARDRILSDVATESMYVSGLLQAIARDVVTQPAWETHRRTVRGILRDRRDQLVAAVQEHAPRAHLTRIPSGGLNLWVQLAEGIDADRVVRDCAAAGVMIAPGSEWFPAEASGPFVRLNYSGPEPHRFAEAARMLGGVLDGVS
ncbi:PLP-dependent aminotransferase family protein [Microcella alkalica]